MRETEYEKKMKSALITLLADLSAGRQPTDPKLEEIVRVHVMRDGG